MIALTQTKDKKMKNQYMAYNHNGTELMLKPSSKSKAEKEAREYSCATGNGAYVDIKV